MSDESFYVWGWRIPFLASAILIGLSMYIQLTMEDTKAFQELQAARENQQNNDNQNSNAIKKSPIIEAIKKYPGRISLAAGAFLSVQVTFYILIAFMLAYGVTSAGMERDEMLFAVLIGPFFVFIYRYFFLRGFLDGWRGFFHSTYIAIYYFIIQCKLYEISILKLNKSPE